MGVDIADQIIDTLESESTEEPVAMTAKDFKDTSSALIASPNRELLCQSISSVVDIVDSANPYPRFCIQ